MPRQRLCCLCMDNSMSKCKRNYNKLLTEENLPKDRQEDGSFGFHMEEIVFDFICLEDDIIEDLCKDFPEESNYERYCVAHSVDYDNKRWGEPVNLSGELQMYSKLCDDVVETNNNETNIYERDNCATTITTKTSNCQIGSAENCPQRAGSDSLIVNSKAKDKDEMRILLCDPNQNPFLVDGIAENHSYRNGPVLLNYKIHSVEKNDAKTCTMNNDNKMRIKVEFLNNLDFPAIEDANRRDHLSFKSKTTKIKVRLPKSVVDGRLKENLKEMIAGHIADQLNSGASLNDGEILHIS